MTLVDTFSGRDTDADWKRLAEADPYWAVLTAPEFRRTVMAESDREAFYRTGRDDVSSFAGQIERFTGRAPRGGLGLDFGCGCGRLTEPMADYVDQAYGYDVAEAMLDEARARSGRPTYVATLPDGPFDWINSHIVFQHIPPQKGMALLERLLERLAPGGAVSLQFAFEPYGERIVVAARHDLAAARSEVRPPPPARPGLWRRAVAALAGPGAAPPNPPVGHMSMFAYDLPAVLAALRRRGVRDVGLHATDHGDGEDGWRGYMIVGRRAAEAAPATPPDPL